MPDHSAFGASTRFDAISDIGPVARDIAKRKTKKAARQTHIGSFTVKEWCQHRRISPAMFYKMDQQGVAPRSHYAGSKRLISGEADAEWLEERESEAANAQAA